MIMRRQKLHNTDKRFATPASIPLFSGQLKRPFRSLKQAMEKQMTCSESVVVDIEDGEDIELIEPGSLEWFRSHAPLPLVLQAFFEIEQHRVESGLPHASAKSACGSDIWDFLETAEVLAEWFELFDDPNAREIVARLRKLTGCDGRLRSEKAAAACKPSIRGSEKVE